MNLSTLSPTMRKQFEPCTNCGDGLLLEPMQKCKECGRTYAPVKSKWCPVCEGSGLVSDHMSNQTGYKSICQQCRGTGGAAATQPQAREPVIIKGALIEKPNSERRKHRAAKPKRASGPNATEAAFLKILQARYPGAEIRYNFRLRISDWLAPVEVHYKVDWLVILTHDSYGSTAIGYEVKHGERPYHSDELIRPKWACENNPGLKEVWLATFIKASGEFKERRIA